MTCRLHGLIIVPGCRGCERALAGYRRTVRLAEIDRWLVDLPLWKVNLMAIGLGALFGGTLVAGLTILDWLFPR